MVHIWEDNEKEINISKIRNPEDMEGFNSLPTEQLNRIIRDTPEYLLETMGKLLGALLYNMEQPEEKTEEAAKARAEAAMRAVTENALRITKYIAKMLANGHSDTEIKEALQHEFGLTREQAEEEYQKAIE